MNITKMNKEPDVKYLINELAYGESQLAMKLLFTHYYPKLILFISYYIKVKQDAEEVLSETFYAIWKQRKRLSEMQNINSYIYRIAKNITFDYLKQREKTYRYIISDTTETEILVQSQPDPEKELISVEMTQQLNDAINMLPHKSKIAFKLIREQKLKYKEAAEIMEISVKTLEAHMSLATKRLIDILSEEMS